MNLARIAYSAAVLLSTALLSAPASAQLFRAYLASSGNDAHPCTLPQPCRLLPRALTVIASGGEIWLLDSANYNTGPVVIGKSVSILAVPGAVGSFVAAGGDALQITASDLAVSLRNVVVVPLTGTASTHGVNMTGASSLVVENSVFANLDEAGIRVEGGGRVRVTNSVFRGNGDAALSLSNGATGEISGSKMTDNELGGVAVHADTAATTRATVTDCVMVGGGRGVGAFANGQGAISEAHVIRSTVDGTQNGLVSWVQTAGGTTLLTVSGSMVTNNNIPFVQIGTGSTLRSFGNNHVDSNGTDVGTVTTVSLR